MEALRVAQGASSYTIKSSNASGEYGFGAKTGIVADQERRRRRRRPSPRGDFRISFRRRRSAARVPAWKLFEHERRPLRSRRQDRLHRRQRSAALRYRRDAACRPTRRGVEQHAADRRADPDRTTNWRGRTGRRARSFSSAVALSLALALALPLSRRRSAALFGAWPPAASTVGSCWAFSRHGLLLDPIMPSLSAGAVYICGVLALYGLQAAARSGRSARPSGATSRRRSSPSSPPTRTMLQLGGEERALTLMFWICASSRRFPKA